MGLNKRKKRLQAASVTLNLSARKNLNRLALQLRNCSQPLLLNLGCGQRSLELEALAFLDNIKIIGLDLFPYPQVQVQGNALHLPFRDETFNAIVCQALLEHTEDPVKVVKEMERCLKRGGLVYVETPFLQGYHPDPEDFYRFTLKGLRLLFQNFTCLDSGICAGPNSALAWILRDYLAGLMTGYSGGKMETILKIFISWLLFPLKYLDRILTSRPSAANLASAFYFLGRKE